MQSETIPTPPGQAPKGLKTAGFVAIAVALGVVAVGTVTRMHDTTEAQRWSDARSIPMVHLVAVTPAASSGTLTLPGTMAAWNAAKLYARVPGYVQSWSKDIGNVVAAGQALGRIDTPELDQQIAQARADLASARANAVLAKSTAARWNDLLSSHSVSQQEADEKNGELAVRNAAVNAAAANLGRLIALKGFATIRAPFAGVVTQRTADIGDLVGPNSGTQNPLFSVADLGRIRIYVNVPQSYSAGIRPGMNATLVVPDYPGRTFTAQVIGTSGAINVQSGTFQVQLVTPNPGEVLKPGGYAQVSFDVPGSKGTVQIPSSAIVFRAHGSQVAMVGADGRARLQPVVIGRDLGGTLEITSGLKPGDRVIDNPPDSIATGELVRVQQGNDA